VNAVALHRRGQETIPAPISAEKALATETILGVFAHVDTTVRALEELRARGYHDLTVLHADSGPRDRRRCSSGTGR